MALSSKNIHLRQILDWMLYAKSQLDDEFWDASFKEKAEMIGMSYLAKVVTRMCQMYFGLTSGITWCKDADDELATLFVQYISKSGNFGKKNDSVTRDIHTGVRRYLTHPTEIFSNLTSVGMTHMEEAGLKGRKSIAWLYQIGHLSAAIFRKRIRFNIVKELRRNSEEVEFLERLKLTRI